MRILGYEINRVGKSYRRIGSAINSWASGEIDWMNVDPQRLINEYRGLIYTCSNKNSLAVARQNLRLFVAKPQGEKSLQPTKALEPKQKEYIYDRHDLLIKKAYRSGSKITVEEVMNHPFLDLIRNINPFFNKTDFFYLTQTFLELTGECYWYVATNKIGIPQELWILPTQYTSPVAGKSKYIKEYVFRAGTEEKIFKEKEVVFHKFPSPQQFIRGKSPLSAVLGQVAIRNSSTVYENAIYKNMGIIPGYFTTDANLGDTDFKRLNQQLDKYRGAKNAGKTPLLTNGLKYETTAINPKDLIGAINNKLSREEIAGAFGVSLAQITMEDSNKANALAGERAHEKGTVSPRLKFLEEKMNERLLPMYDEKLFCAFDNPVHEDNEEVRKRDETDAKWGLRSADEIRKAQGLPPAEDGQGDRRIVPLNYIFVDMLEDYYKNGGKKPPDKPDSQGGENPER